ncbi:MAG: replicative DNA helicase [Campylobacterota bacterium]|nr:replicative DNA helicase [Campylobacterota bacterium]
MDNTYSLNIERAVLCSIFFDQSIIEDILGVLKYQDFYNPAHQKIFAIMEELNNKDIPLDEEFIRKRLVSTDVTDSNLIEILSANPISNTMAYVKEIKDAAIKRELVSLATLIKKTTLEENLSAQESVDKIQNELYKITSDSNSSDLKNMEQIIVATKEHIKEIQSRGTTYLTGQTTGFYSLDKKTTGFNPGDLVIIAARPAMGKTAIVLNTTLKNLEKGDGVIFFSLEMPETQLMTRLLSIKTGIPLQNLRKGELDPTQAKLLEHAFKEMENKKLFVDDNGNLNINQLRARARKIAQNEDNNIKMIVIDYLQLMSGSGGTDRRLTVDEISRGLKLLAREINIPIIALSQLNRGLESRPDKRPMLSDIRESGAIEQDADIIAFVYRDDIYKERDEQRKEKEASDKGETYKSAFINKPIEEAEIIIGKQRNGSIGTVKLDFHKELTKFVDKDIGNGSMPEITTFDEKETNIDISEIMDDDTEPFEYETQIDIPDIF